MGDDPALMPLPSEQLIDLPMEPPAKRQKVDEQPPGPAKEPPRQPDRPKQEIAPVVAAQKEAKPPKARADPPPK